mgnify:CR=1 FL=1
MLRIRLRRQGAKKQPTYRIVVTDQRAARDGKFIEIIGHYNPRTEPSVAKVDEERAYYWLDNGAQPSDAVNRIFSWTGTLDRFARMKKGDDIQKLIAESIEAGESRPNPTKTRRDAPEKSASNKKSESDEKLDGEVISEESFEDSDDVQQPETEVEDSKQDVVAEEDVEDTDDSSDDVQQPETEVEDSKQDVVAEEDVEDTDDSSDDVQQPETKVEDSEQDVVGEDSNDSESGSSDVDEDNKRK